jgi:hypothetical protein
MAASLGWHLTKFAPLAPDVKDLETVRRGAVHRIMRQTPPITRNVARRIRAFVRVWIRKNVRQLGPETDTTIETWLNNSNYTEARKAELRRASEMIPPDRRIYKNKSFCKHEYYDVPKHARWINSRSDKFKTLTGPVFKQIEKVLYDLPYFIKKIPVDERAAYIEQYLGRSDGLYIATDYTCYESALVPKIMKIVEIQLYNWVTKRLPCHREFMDYVTHGLTSLQRCSQRTDLSKVKVETYCRMSGDMCTSLGNGFTNLMIAKYVARECGWDVCEGVVEGDDGLFLVDGQRPVVQDFANCGFFIKSDFSREVGEAGFCQMYHTHESQTNLVDPRKMLLRGGWSMASSMHGGPRVRKELSRAKAFSQLMEAPTNPITSSMSRWVIRSTAGVSPRVDRSDPEWWWWNQLSGNIQRALDWSKTGPTMAQRCLVERKFGVSVKCQFDLEAYFDSLPPRLQPIDHPAIDELFGSWESYAATFLTETCRKGEPI